MLGEAIPPRTGVWSRARCFMGIVAVVAACATDDVTSPASGPEGERVRDGASDVGPCPGPAVNGGVGRPVWARSPETGDCCRYEGSLAAPRSWLPFATEAECQSSCRCSALDGFSGMYGWYATERSSLECRCSAETCPSTIAEAEQLSCRASSVARSEGCGQVMIWYANGATGESWIFERSLASADAGGAGVRLIGAGQLSDVPLGPCQAYEWIAGRAFECDDVTTCQVCNGGAASSIPPCE
jgi:hypothetical protein